MFQKWKDRRAHWDEMVHIKGADVLKSSNMQKEKKFMQHGKVSVYSHSVKVAVLSLFLAELFREDNGIVTRSFYPDLEDLIQDIAAAVLCDGLPLPLGEVALRKQ